MSDRLDSLVTLRDDLVVWMAEAPVDRRAALVAQFRATLAEIDVLTPAEVKGDGVDEIANRRTARRQRAAKSAARTGTDT